MAMANPAQMMGMQPPFMNQRENNNPKNKLFIGDIPRTMTQVDIF